MAVWAVMLNSHPSVLVVLDFWHSRKSQTTAWHPLIWTWILMSFVECSSVLPDLCPQIRESLSRNYGPVELNKAEYRNLTWYHFSVLDSVMFQGKILDTVSTADHRSLLERLLEEMSDFMNPSQKFYRLKNDPFLLTREWRSMVSHHSFDSLCCMWLCWKRMQVPKLWWASLLCVLFKELACRFLDRRRDCDGCSCSNPKLFWEWGPREVSPVRVKRLSIIIQLYQLHNRSIKSPSKVWLARDLCHLMCLLSW